MLLRSNAARGFTLIEMMIAMVITLMMVFAMVEAFKWIGDATTDGRAQIEMAGQIRAARYRLELDLNGATVPLRPWVEGDAYPGYFELVEGIGSDANPTQFIKSSNAAAASYINFNFADANNALAAASQTLFGDLDDVLMFTARNDEEPFRGRYDHDNNNATPPIVIESNVAEIFWWAELNDLNNNDQWEPRETFTIRRRVLLIRPDLNNASDMLMGSSAANYVNDVATFLMNNDISVRPVHNANFDITGIAANSLGTLSQRGNRTAHDPIVRNNGAVKTGLSNGNYLSPLAVARLPAYGMGSSNEGEDVILTNVTAFDFRVWDPNVPLVSDGGGLNEALVPGDLGYLARYLDSTGAVIAANVVGNGAYIDLGILRTGPSPGSPTFSSLMNVKSQLPQTPFVYDPWPATYEKDGLDQDGDNTIDEGTNGLDDDSVSGLDDYSEKETAPPYPHPLRGLRVSIRMYEADTQQVKQSSHEMNFEN
jgi:prepilin-type N-terminal cleavage/methylation domain-containing protein